MLWKHGFGVLCARIKHKTKAEILEIPPLKVPPEGKPLRETEAEAGGREGSEAGQPE